MKAIRTKTTSKTTTPNASTTVGTAAMVLGPFLDFAEQGELALFNYMRHCGIQIDSLDASDPRSAEDLILDHYRLADGSYDVNMSARDLARWPAIAARIHELRDDQTFLGDLIEQIGTTQKVSAKSRYGAKH